MQGYCLCKRQHVPVSLVMRRPVKDKLLPMSLQAHKKNVGAPTSRQAVRPNRGQSRHAYQLENALNPITRDQTAKKNNGIPETIPKNAMAPPQALRKNRKQDSNTKVTTALKLPRSAATF
ncbi:hypothetical protein BYT27DRAFT_7262543 [Phlegmacium glaucopus]|nr:hypothetical protein BYT27DRAFT_7262543 [Phlegmacium glaucopus]